MRRAVCAAVLLPVFFGAPAIADPAQAGPDLQITASVDSRAYVPGQPIPVSLKITNIGTAAATAAKADYWAVSGGDFGVGNGSEWQEFYWHGPGATIPAGTTRELLVHGTFYRVTGSSLQVEFSVRTAGDANPANDKQTVTIQVVPPGTTGDVSGVLYTDKNNNEKPDRGEGVAGIELTLYAFGDTRKTTTDSAGRFEWLDQPARAYSIWSSYNLPGGWVTNGTTNVIVDGTSGSENVGIRAVRPLSDKLKASAKFNGGPYQPGDVAQLTVTWSNRGSETLSGIIAGCDRAGSSTHLVGTSDPQHWGDLVYSRGVTIEPGQTRSFQVTGIVPERSTAEGTVYVACDFGWKDESYLMGYPTVLALAKVPGKSGTGSGWMYHDRNENHTVDDGETIPNLRFSLIDPLTGKVAARVKTGADGTYTLPSLPVGWYSLDFHGPWELKNKNEYMVISTDGTGVGRAVLLMPRGR